jgi:quercetin dioxygenase-like cupin family protein
MQVRRIVTGLDAEGKSCVFIDDFASNATSRRPGHQSRLVWVTDSAPARFGGAADEGARQVGRPPPPRGTVCRVIDIEPGCAAEMHKTDTVDYVFVMSGEMDMVLEKETVHLRPGDVIVQRGTLHNWVNNGTQTCRIAAVLIDGVP